MEENNLNNFEKLENEPVVNNIKNEYNHNKTLDFITGFFGFYIFWYIVGSINSIYYNSFVSFASFIIIIFLFFFFHKIKRKYIATGMIWAILLPLIFFLIVLGGCFISLNR